VLWVRYHVAHDRCDATTTDKKILGALAVDFLATGEAIYVRYRCDSQSLFNFPWCEGGLYQTLYSFLFSLPLSLSLSYVFLYLAL